MCVQEPQSFGVRIQRARKRADNEGEMCMMFCRTGQKQWTSGSRDTKSATKHTGARLALSKGCRSALFDTGLRIKHPAGTAIASSALQFSSPPEANTITRSRGEYRGRRRDLLEA